MSLLLLGVRDQSGPAWFRVQVRLLARALAGMVSVGWPWSVTSTNSTIYFNKPPLLYVYGT